MDISSLPVCVELERAGFPNQELEGRIKTQFQQNSPGL
jgi:hypothetical protein